MKRFLLTLTVLMASITTALAEVFTGSCGANVTYTLNTETGVLKIEGTGEMTSYSGSYLNGTYVTTAPWRNYYQTLKSVTISEGVTSIGEYAFSGCSSLTSVTIPDGVTSIGNYAFYNGSSLTSITIPSSVASIGNYAFYGCSGLTSINIPESVTSIGYYAFYGCSGLTSINIPESVTSIGSYAFYYCSSLTSIIIPEGVTSIGNEAFYNCSSLTSITIPSSMTSIGSYAFYNCNNLKKVFNLSSLPINRNYSDFGYVAYYANEVYNEFEILNDFYFSINSDGKYVLCNYIGTSSHIVLPNNYKGNSYMISDYTFYNYDIKSFTVGSGVVYIGNNVFKNKPTKTIWLTNTPPSGYSYAAGTINYVSNNQFGFSNQKVYPYLSSVFTVDGVKYAIVNPSERTCDVIDCTYDETSEINIGKTVNYRGINLTVNNVNEYAFYDNDSIKTISIDHDGPIGRYAMSECSNLENATLGEQLTDIGEYSFSNCSKLIRIDVPNSVASLGQNAFSSCVNLSQAKIGNGVPVIPTYLFRGCSSLNNVEIGTGVQTINDYAFVNCSSLPRIEIPQNVAQINNSVFNGCNKLAEIIIKDRTTPLSLGYYGSSSRNLFYDCPLDYVYIGGKITYSTSSGYGYSPFYRNLSLRSVEITDTEDEIYDNEFYGCTGLKTVKIGDGVKKIGRWAFSGCSSLESFAFGASLQSIGQEAFSDCANVTKLVSEAVTPPTCGSQALEDLSKWDCTLYVPEASISAYQGADQWKDFFFVNDNSSEVEDDGNKMEQYLIADSKPYGNIHPFQTKELTYTRTFDQTGWEALYLPFEMNYEDWNDQFVVARINAFYQYDDNHDGTIDRSVLEAILVKDGQLEANYPYLVKAKAVGEKSIVKANTMVYPAEANSIDCSTVDTRFVFTGTYNNMDGATLVSRNAYIMNGGALTPATSEMALTPFRWYLTAESRNGHKVGMQKVRVVVTEEPSETGIDYVEAESTESQMYTIDGRSVKGSPKQAGLYIVNGKKVMIK